jgi:hypothetical protein
MLVRERYGTEVGDVLMSLHNVLIREEQEAEASNLVALRPAPARAPVADRVAPMPVRTWTTGMVDSPTGAGTVLALRRDVVLEQLWSGQGDRGFLLVVVKMLPVVDGPVPADPEAAEIMLQALVRAAPQALSEGDRVYRSGWQELTLLLSDADVESARAGLRALATAVRPILARLGLPAVRLMMRLLDPNAVLALVKPVVEPTSGHTPRAGSGGSRLSAAI